MPFTTTISPASEVADLKQPASLGLPTRLLPMLLVTATFILANIIWSVYDHGLPDWDCAEHILNGLAYRDLLKHPKLFNADWIHTFLSVNYLYPPATYVLSGLTKLVFGISPWVDGLLKAFYQAVLCLSIYGLTKDLLKSRIAATMAVISINLYPQTSIYSHQLMLDFPMLAMVALAVWCLIAWQEKATTKNTICLGLAIGLACLTKQLAGAFLLVPVLIVLINTLAKRQFDKTGKLLLAGA
ncbi:MAG: glycosyltransferase family 39 protein, partial [Candidatus Obscuribacterales bacterium]|nr:glycosyltransferase family 39 protein [Candidatus Obscuribacterales bacterium]